MNELVKLVQEWSKNKGLDKADSRGQFLKIVEEVGEVAAALARSDVDNLKEEIGDVVVTLIIYAQQNNVVIDFDLLPNPYLIDKYDNADHMLSILIHVRVIGGCSGDDIYEDTEMCLESLITLAHTYSLTLEECLQAAYTKISGRTGKIVNGIFVKHADIKTPEYDSNAWPKNKRDSEGDSDNQKELKI